LAVAGLNESQTTQTRMSVPQLRRRILNWYRKHKRDLPWRQARDPYRIWVSEIMLQQTRVAAVIPFYERFLARFPDVGALATAPEQELLAAWAGLGYYARARNLQRAAKKIQELGGFPSDHASIRELPGVGDYTAAAIGSIAFNLRHAVLDGNAARVLSRLTAERGNVDSGVVKKRLLASVDRLIDAKRPGEFNQALMELGATVCLPKQPRCAQCPWACECQAFRLGIQHELPMKAGRPDAVGAEKQVLMIERAGKILAWQRPSESRRLAGFWELPEKEQLPGARVEGRVAGFRHTIVNTNYRIDVLRASVPGAPKGFHWFSTKELSEIPLSTTAKKALACLTKVKGQQST
jgi:A/G-specific adenine glycosylase